MFVESYWNRGSFCANRVRNALSEGLLAVISVERGGFSFRFRLPEFNRELRGTISTVTPLALGEQPEGYELK